ncbi:hypothetical protein R6Q57_022635 [Mikania cordata]
MKKVTFGLVCQDGPSWTDGLAAAMRCRRILRMRMGTPRCIDWGVLADAGEAVLAGSILGEDTPWTRLFELAELPTYRLITVEFLSTFRYTAHQAAVREEDDEELPPDIEFSLGGEYFEMSIERFVVHLCIYYEPETVRDDFTQGLTQGEEGVMRAWWAQISDTPFIGYRVRATMIRDPLIHYIHRCIVASPCNLARCFALYYASFYHRKERGTLWGGAFVTHIARSRGMVDMLDDLPAIEPRKLDRRTLISMKLAADIPARPGRRARAAGRWCDAGPETIQEEPVQSQTREVELPQHPPHVYRAVRLTEPLEALLHHIAARCGETAQQMAESDRRRAT